jgi:4-hydroxybenzoyl-CoA thioesterase/acyl-CoA thioester hydrolase
MTVPFQTTRCVQFRDTDAAGIVHFSVFFNYMEEVEHQLLRHLGTSVVLRDDQGTISWPRVSAKCNYLRAVRFEDTLDVEAWVDRLGKKSVTYAFRFSHEGQAVATGSMTAVCCRMKVGDGMHSIAIPESLTSKLTTLLRRETGEQDAEE